MISAQSYCVIDAIGSKMAGAIVEDPLNMFGVALILFIVVYIVVRLLTHKH
jgi:hypothetical protein